MQRLCVPRVCGGDPNDGYCVSLSGCVFPVYAGVIPESPCLTVLQDGVPRVCGGDPASGVAMQYKMLVFPVYAGVILYRSVVLMIVGMCSPCMRG